MITRADAALALTEDKRTGGQAFPHGDPTNGGDIGMTLRDHFAGQALTGLCLLSSSDYSAGPCNHSIVTRAYVLADQMIAERDK